MPEDEEYLPSSQKGNESLTDMMKQVDLLSDLFKFTLGTKVRNRHNEDGYIEMCGIDNRGEMYLVNLPEGRSHW